jgi:hypothetical protein
MDDEIKKAILEIRDLLNEFLETVREQRIEQKRMMKEFESRKTDSQNLMKQFTSMLGNPQNSGGKS